MLYHSAAGHPPLPCSMGSHGRCRICDLIDRDGPHYREDYRRRFHPEEFGETPAPRIAPPAPPPPAPVATPMLAGDIAEAAFKRLGADRLAKWYEAKTGKPCGCASRKEAMNKADAALRRWLAR
jgi:hypothetical protein